MPDLRPIAEHDCTGRCGRRVPNRIACGSCYDRLPRRLQLDLTSSWRYRHQNPAGRRNALAAAAAWLAAHPLEAPGA